MLPRLRSCVLHSLQYMGYFVCCFTGCLFHSDICVCASSLMSSCVIYRVFRLSQPLTRHNAPHSFLHFSLCLSLQPSVQPYTALCQLTHLLLSDSYAVPFFSIFSFFKSVAVRALLSECKVHAPPSHPKHTNLGVVATFVSQTRSVLMRAMQKVPSLQTAIQARLKWC